MAFIRHSRDRAWSRVWERAKQGMRKYKVPTDNSDSMIPQPNRIRQKPKLFLGAGSLLAAMFLACSLSSAQPPNLDHLMTERLPDCDDIAYNSMRLVPKYFDAGRVDSAKVVLEYWRYNCNYDDQAYAANILMEMYLDSVPIDDSELYEHLGLPPDGVYGFMLKRNPSSHADQMELERKLDFGAFIDSLAATVAAKQNLPRFEHLVALHFSGRPDSLKEAFDSREFPERVSQQEYLGSLSDWQSSRWDTQFGVFSSVWIPNQGLSVLGVHPEIGMLYGFFSKRLVVNLLTSFRFIDAPNDYRFKDGDSTYVSNNYFGFTAGIEGGYSVLLTPKNELSLVGGIGFDSFTVVPEDDDSDEDGVSANALNLNFGLDYRLFFKNNSYLGLRVRYNALNYNSHGGSDLSGDAVGIGLVYGGVGY